MFDREKICAVRGDNGESTWSRHYAYEDCKYPAGHRGKHSWERRIGWYVA